MGRSSEVLTARAFNIGQNTLDFVINFFVMLYVLFSCCATARRWRRRRNGPCR